MFAMSEFETDVSKETFSDRSQIGMQTIIYNYLYL